MKTTTSLAALSAVAALSLSACASTVAPAKFTAAARAKSAPVVPDTEAAARSAATTYFALYAADEWEAAWRMLTPAEQREAPETTYAAFHAACPAESQGMTFAVKNVTMAGSAAVITYTLPVLASMGSATLTEQWTPGGWQVGWTTGSGDPYSHGSVAADVKAAKKAGDCASN